MRDDGIVAIELESPKKIGCGTEDQSGHFLWQSNTSQMGQAGNHVSALRDWGTIGAFN